MIILYIYIYHDLQCHHISSYIIIKYTLGCLSWVCQKSVNHRCFKWQCPWRFWSWVHATPWWLDDPWLEGPGGRAKGKVNDSQDLTSTSEAAGEWGNEFPTYNSIIGKTPHNEIMYHHLSINSHSLILDRTYAATKRLVWCWWNSAAISEYPRGSTSPAPNSRKHCLVINLDHPGLSR